jgi:hypothetical protein
MVAPDILAPCPAIQPVAWHLSVGDGIGILGFLGVVAPLIREHMGRREKAIWTAVMAVLLYGELRSIRLDQIQHDREQAFADCQQLRSFKQIENGIEASIKNSQQQFQETISGLGGLNHRIGTTSVESVLRRHQEIRDDLAQLIKDIDSSRVAYQIRSYDQIGNFETLLWHAPDPEALKKQHSLDLQKQQQQYAQSFAKEFGPRIVDLMKQLHIALGEGNETDNLTQFCAKCGPDQVDVCISHLKSLAGELSP